MKELDDLLRSAVDQLNLRHFFEQISRDITFWRKLPKRFNSNKIKISPECGLRYWVNSIEKADPNLLRWTEDLLDDSATVWDIGSNLGIFAAAAESRRQVNDVIALEPDLTLASYIRSTVDKNDLGETIKVLPVAASDTEQIARFSVSDRSRARNSLEDRLDSNVLRETLVPTISLDFLLRETSPPDFLKIDVEGAELSVLQGAKDLLQTSRPKIVCEVSQENEHAVTTLLKGFNYELFDAGDPNYSSVERAVFDTLATPE